MSSNLTNYAPEQPEYFFQRCQEISDILATVTNSLSTVVTEINADGLIIRGASTNPENERYVGEFIAYSTDVFCFRLVHLVEPLFVEREADATDGAPVSYFGFPICFEDGKLWGTVCIMEATPDQDYPAVKESIGHFRDILERELLTAGLEPSELPDAATA